MMPKYHKHFILILAITACLFAGFYLGKGLIRKVFQHKLASCESKESCLECHGTVTGFSEAHDPCKIGCSSCHLGDPLNTDKDMAHRGMVLIPGNLNQAVETCGAANCHPAISRRIQTSMMTTASGIVSVDRFVFGESDKLAILSDIRKIKDSPADQHLRNLCAHCHLGREKKEYGPVDELARGGGCVACHLNYSDEALEALHESRKTDTGDDFLIAVHPSLDLDISDEHCFGCHSRSGRISLNYGGWHETLLNKEDITASKVYRVLMDQRVLQYITDDAHHARGMKCIDCHISYELMGDGRFHFHKEQQTIVRCEDCHITGSPEWIGFDDLDDESRKILLLRKTDTANVKLIQAHKYPFALLNTYMDSSGRASLKIKGSQKVLTLSPPKAVCVETQAHAALSCESCHTSWTPQCVGCHNAFNRDQKGYDLLDDMETAGTWIEYVGKFLAEKPSLGIRFNSRDQDGQSRTIVTVGPGMIMTIDLEEFERPGDHLLFHRLFAPVSAHTISGMGRSCKSCHNDPLALGYGRGKLAYDVVNGKGKWSFIPRYAPSKHDNLPEDAWIGFLSERKNPVATRDNIRPFSLKEQKKILLVGACLSCHDEQDSVMRKSLYDFRSVLIQRAEVCVLPDWD